MKNTSILDNVSIVLVETKAPANIGAVARSMMNMGLHRLVLVDPARDSHGEALRLAAGAGKILETAVTCSSLSDVVRDQGLVIGTSRHRGRLRRNIRAPRDMAAHVLPLLDRNTVSVVFGNEVNGLKQEDLALCHEFISIPSSDEFPSLNLSHAVMIVAYELFLASLGPPVPVELDLASGEDREQFYGHLQTILEKIGFLDRDHPERIMFSLRQMFGRARLETRDVSILRGILSVLDRNIREHEER
jgi:tRNA/rRNA methyltransferase